MNDEVNKDKLMHLTVKIFTSYVSNNELEPEKFTDLLKSVYDTLSGLQSGVSNIGSLPAVPINESINPDYLICLEDGKKFKSLKRHLRTHYGLSPEAYREKWGLPSDYPMVAPSYAVKRSMLAKKMGLGQKMGNGASNKVTEVRDESEK
jgi:predicted transcriptional regulator